MVHRFIGKEWRRKEKEKRKKKKKGEKKIRRRRRSRKKKEERDIWAEKNAFTQTIQPAGVVNGGYD